MNPLFRVPVLFAKYNANKFNYGYLTSQAQSGYWKSTKLDSEFEGLAKGFSKIRKEIKPEHFTTLTPDEALTLGFQHRGGNSYLIPSYLWGALPAGLEITSVSGPVLIVDNFWDLECDNNYLPYTIWLDALTAEDQYIESIKGSSYFNYGDTAGQMVQESVSTVFGEDTPGARDYMQSVNCRVLKMSLDKLIAESKK
jgi:hypothetical protein